MLKSKKKIIKRCVARTMDSLGLLHPIGNPFILMYHRVIDPVSLDYIELPGMYVSVETFSMHVNLLKERYSIVPLHQLLQAHSDGEKLQNVCSITFDDGWLDNYSNVFPIINRDKFPVSIFLSTNLINGRRSFWAEECCYFLSQRENVRLLEKNFSPRETAFLRSLFRDEVLTPENMTDHIETVKNLEPVERQALIEKIVSANHTGSRRKRETLNWEEIIEMKESGYVDFYPHGHNHVFLPELGIEDLSFEVEESIRQIKTHIPDQGINIFCYPSGRYNDQVIACLKHNNIEYGLYRAGGYMRSDSCNYCIPRILVHDDISDSRTLFKYYLSRQQR